MAETNPTTTDASEDGDSAQTIQAHSPNASKLLADAAVAVEQIKEHLELAPEAKAEIALFAQEAKTAAQGKLNALVADAQEIVDQLKVQLATVTETDKQVTATSKTLNELLETARRDSNSVEAIRIEAEQKQAVVVTLSGHMEDARVHADKVRTAIDSAVTNAQQAATTAESWQVASRAALDKLDALAAPAQATKANLDANAEAVVKALELCQAYAATSKKLADVAETTEARVAAYESRLAELEKIANDRLKTIEGLLPGATSTGLASAFGTRRKFFQAPQRFWQFTFIACMAGLMLLAYFAIKPYTSASSEEAVQAAALTWESLALSLLYRVPFAAPLIWLAIHASHKSALAQRVEEDYAFKETVSRSFEGYRREMAELAEKAAPDTAVAQLCSGVLAIITNPPGRLYERHRLAQTPLSAVAETAGSLSIAASKLADATKGKVPTVKDVIS